MIFIGNNIKFMLHTHIYIYITYITHLFYRFKVSGPLDLAQLQLENAELLEILQSKNKKVSNNFEGVHIIS